MIRYITLTQARARWPDPRKLLHAGSTIRTPDGRCWCVRGSFTNHREEYNMKPGPFKSSTHGPIKVSMRARELLLANQLAAQTAIANGEYSTNGQALSRSRGDLAQYISELETNQKPCAELGEGVAALDAARRRAWERMRDSLKPGPMFYVTGLNAPLTVGYKKLSGGILDDRLDALRCSLETNFLNPLKEKTMEECSGKNTAGAPPVEKTRSQTLEAATVELCAAQRNLESLQRSTPGATSVSLYSQDENGINGARGDMNIAVAELVKEQWDTLTKKALARAKARVVKAEKAVAALLAG